MPCRCSEDEEQDLMYSRRRSARKSLEWLRAHDEEGYNEIVSGLSCKTKAGSGCEESERRLRVELGRVTKERDMYKKLYLATEEGKKKMKSFEEWLADGN